MDHCCPAMPPHTPHLYKVRELVGFPASHCVHCGVILETENFILRDELKLAAGQIKPKGRFQKNFFWQLKKYSEATIILTFSQWRMLQALL